MSRFKILKAIGSLFKTEEENNIIQIDKKSLKKEIKIPLKVWKKGYNPLRHIVLWGVDDKNNPSFLTLYGRHQFKGEKEGNYNILEDDVKYTCYTIFKGNEGHLPSFKAVKIIENNTYNYNTKKRNNSIEMYYKKGLKYHWGWDINDKYIVKEFQNLKQDQQISVPYFTKQSQLPNICFEGFKISKNPNDILKLEAEFDKYFKIIIDIVSYPNIYIRKKKLKELLMMNPPKEIYTKFLEIGSTELISGLFLELAKMKNTILLDEAKNLIETEIKYADENYAKGVKRCIKIYLNSFDEEVKADRIKYVYKSLNKMDLHLIKIHGKDIPKDKILPGSAYRKYANCGSLQDYCWGYNQNTRKHERIEAQKYEIGDYTDGVKLKIVDLKSIIQEAEIYELADVIGKIAYYLDAPRLTYNLRGSGRIKTLKYFHRYLRRIINLYAQNNPDKFMEAMKYLLTSYNQYDCLCKFKDNFQFNEFVKFYLYYDFKEKAPTGHRNWQVRYKWISNDQLMSLKGRHEFMKEIWDNHLGVVADIATKAQINQVVKACYYTLKDSLKSNEFIENIEYKQLINLSLVSYEPLADMFMNILTNKLKQLNTFDSELMICLIGSQSEKMYEYAMEFFKRTNGVFSPSDIADLLFLDNLQQWEELFKQNLDSQQGDEYVEFIREVINRTSKFLKSDIKLTENINEMLTVSTNKIQQVSEQTKVKLIGELIDTLVNIQKLPEWIGKFIEDVIFSVSYEDLQSLLLNINIEHMKKVTSSRNKRIIVILESIKDRKLPTDSQIIDILSTGNSKMIKILFNILTENTEELSNRFSTLLIMLESEIIVLNNKAEEIFDSMDKLKQQKLHSIIIDSPVFRAYSFGIKKLELIYKDFIPEKFIIQMLEHGSTEVKAYISDKTDKILDNLGNGNEKLFMYYLKTLLLLPNKISKSKDKIYNVIPRFALKYKDKLEEIESILLDIGGSNIIIDSERALVAIAKIRMEVMSLES